MAFKPPRIIPEARTRIASFVHSAYVKFGRSCGLKAMKKDYAEKLITLLDIMLQACTMQFDGRLCRVSGDLARPLTVPEMATFTEFNQRSVERMIHDLKDLKLIQSEKQFKRMFPEGLKVAAVWRLFTRLFWEKLGLWSLFVESVKYAAHNGKLQPKNPIRRVGKKKSATAAEAERRKIQRDNQLFLFMAQCEHRKGEKACSGNYMAEEVCAMCRRFSS